MKNALKQNCSRQNLYSTKTSVCIWWPKWSLPTQDASCGIKLMTKWKMLSFTLPLINADCDIRNCDQTGHAYACLGLTQALTQTQACTHTIFTENSKFHSDIQYIIECQRGLVIKSKWVFHEFEASTHQAVNHRMNGERERDKTIRRKKN